MKLPNLVSRINPRRGHYALKTALPGFDEVYYRYWYRDVHGYPGGPLAHYLRHGWLEGRDPSAGFSTSGYLNANSDVAQNGVNPLIHFLENGLAEGRSGWQKDPHRPAPRPTQYQEPQKLLAPPTMKL